MQKQTFFRAIIGILILLVMAADLRFPAGQPACAAVAALRELKLKVAVYEREDRNAPPLVLEGIIRLRIDPGTGTFTGEIIPAGEAAATIMVDGQLQGRALHAVFRNVFGEGDVFVLGTADRGEGGTGPIVRARGLALGPKFFDHGVWEGGE
jgi:hypothetical protein